MPLVCAAGHVKRAVAERFQAQDRDACSPDLRGIRGQLLAESPLSSSSPNTRLRTPRRARSVDRGRGCCGNSLHLSRPRCGARLARDLDEAAQRPCAAVRAGGRERGADQRGAVTGRCRRADRRGQAPARRQQSPSGRDPTRDSDGERAAPADVETSRRESQAGNAHPCRPSATAHAGRVLCRTRQVLAAHLVELFRTRWARTSVRSPTSSRSARREAAVRPYPRALRRELELIGISRMIAKAEKLGFEPTPARRRHDRSQCRQLATAAARTRRVAAIRRRRCAASALSTRCAPPVWDVELTSHDGSRHWRTIVDRAMGQVLNVSDLVDRAFNDAQVNRWMLPAGTFSRRSRASRRASTRATIGGSSTTSFT